MQRTDRDAVLALGDKPRVAALLDSQYRAGAKAGWNAHFAEDPEAAIARLIEYGGGLSALKSTEPLTIGEDGLVGAIDAAMTDLDLLRSAIEKSDPQRELLIRTTDIWRRLNAALRNRSPDRGEG